VLGYFLSSQHDDDRSIDGTALTSMASIAGTFLIPSRVMSPPASQCMAKSDRRPSDAGGYSTTSNDDDDESGSPPEAMVVMNAVIERGMRRPQNRGSAGVVVVVVVVERRLRPRMETSKWMGDDDDDDDDDDVRRTMPTPKQPGVAVVDDGEKDRMPTTQHPANRTNGVLDLMPRGIMMFPLRVLDVWQFVGNKYHTFFLAMMGWIRFRREQQQIPRYVNSG
jgi:hypothetical protein